MSIIKKIIIFLCLLVILLLLLIGISVLLVDYQSKNRTYSTLKSIPYNRVGMVLGTSKYLRSGVLNPYFAYRMEAAAELYHAGKIDRIVVSGDNRTKYYNEPLDMQNALIELKVPQEHIYLDYAGLRTLDSVVRMDEVFQQKKYTVISQNFHNKRAIFIGHYRGLDVIGYDAQDLSANLGFKVQLREKLAVVKACFDILLCTEPRHGGPTIDIE